ncbi:MAG: ArsR family transcriptional regulator [Candidatus Thermoplasmatota archaeon]|nr:ArsR family transcriptional regulator [Candidatus Thermoplasmatota archaeon]
MQGEMRLSRLDNDIIDKLIFTGMSKNLAKTLVILSKREETTSVQVEKATGLRQPEVSLAMQELRRRGWVTKRDIKKEGKGRPVHAYRISKSFSRIVSTIKKQEDKKIERMVRNMNELRSLTK